MDKLRAAVVGGGLIAGKKHIPAFLKQRRRVVLVAVCDLNRDVARTVANQYGISKTYSDFSEMLAKEKLDLVDICTPPATHAKLAVEAMRTGSHVLIEKPMALSLEDCDSILNASRQCGVTVCVAHSNLFYRSFMKARELVARGDIGDFRGMRIFLSTPTDYMTSQKDHWVHKLPAGVISETGPHIAYMSLAFISPIREVAVNATKLLNFPWSQFEDYRIDLIGDKAISSVVLSYATDQWMARVDILGTDAILIVDLEGMSLLRYRRRDLKSFPIGVSLFSESMQIIGNLLSNGFRFATGRLKSTHDILLEQFLDSVVNGNEPPVTAEEGREVVRVINMIVNRLKEKAV